MFVPPHSLKYLSPPYLSKNVCPPPPLSPKMSVSPLKISVPTPVGENCFSPFPVEMLPPPCVSSGGQTFLIHRKGRANIFHTQGDIYTLRGGNHYMLELWVVMMVHKHVTHIIFRCVSTSRSHKITDSQTHGLTDSQTLSSTWDSLTIPLLFEDVCYPMFEYVLTPCLQTCLHFVYRHVYTMFTLCLQTYLHHIWIHF